MSPAGAPRLAGRIEDVTLPGLLQMLAAKARSGKLSLTCREGSGLLVVRDGRIIYAASNSAREALGNILVCQGLINETTLAQALEVQHSSPEEKRLGTILVEMRALAPGDLDGTIRNQITGVIREMCSWTAGFFAFDPVELPEQGEVGVDARDLVLPGGVPAGEAARDVLDATSFETQPVHYVRPPKAAASGAGNGLASLKTLIAELRSPSFGGEITVWLLRHASATVRRCALFAVTKDGIRGMAQMGFDGGAGSAERVRGLTIPATEPSVFTTVVASRSAFLGPLAHERGNERLAAGLGGGFPGEAAAVPMVVNGNVVAVLYGDNLPSGEPIGTIDSLEVLMLEAGLAMEKTALEVRLRTLQLRLDTR